VETEVIQSIYKQLKFNTMKKLSIIGMLMISMSLMLSSFKKDAGNYISFEIDYSMSIKKLKTSGHYVRVNGKINSKNFSEEKTSGKNTLKMCLINFKDYMTLAGIRKYLDKNNMRPATLKELLVFGAKYPSFIDENHSVFALGSNMKVKDNFVLGNDGLIIIKKDVHVVSFIPYIEKNGFGQRELGMIIETNNFNSSCYFLAFSCE